MTYIYCHVDRGMPQGHHKLPRLFLHVHQWWGWWTKLPGKWSARMRLLWLCSISGVFNLRMYYLLVFSSLFLLSSLWPSVLLYSVIFWGCQSSVPPLLSCPPVVYIPYTWMSPLSLRVFLSLCQFEGVCWWMGPIQCQWWSWTWAPLWQRMLCLQGVVHLKNFKRIHL